MNKGNVMGVEIERKWLPEKEFTDRVKKYAEASEIVQGYLCTEPAVRVRRDGNSYYLTCKNGGGLKHQEYNLPLSETAFCELFAKCGDRCITKTRYRVKFKTVFPDWREELPEGPEGELLLELDVFHGKKDGLIMLEVEFADAAAAAAFQPPAEFGEDVTGKKEYSNAHMAGE